eukprot:1137893-Prymnesium_polylepis.1
MVTGFRGSPGATGVWYVLSTRTVARCLVRTVYLGCIAQHKTEQSQRSSNARTAHNFPDECLCEPELRRGVRRDDTHTPARSRRRPLLGVPRARHPPYTTASR